MRWNEEARKELAESLRCRRAGLVAGAVPAVSVTCCLVATFFSLATALHLQLDVFVTQWQQAQRDHSRRLTDASHSYGHFLHTL